jgi:Fe-S oxidoreductase
MKVVLDLQQGAGSPESLHGRTIQPETLWSCTTCRACVEECPVLIDHLSAIVDMRRHLVGEGRIRGPEQTALRNIGSTGNPWGLPNDERMDWAKDLDVPTVEDNPQPDVLLWVGCAGSFDRRNQQVTRAMVKVLHAAEVNFAVLGKHERCTGDPARRLGDEFTFQEAAMRNVELLGGVKCKSIVTACAHCFNTLKNEYPDFGGDYTVLHHTQFLRQLVDDGRLSLSTYDAGSIVFHDPCYVGRHNGEYVAPRHALDKGLCLPLPLLEADRAKESSFCCGAGGGRMWAEEDIGSRVNLERWEQLKSTGAKTVATACPYCMIMFDDAAKQDEASGVRVKDVAELIADACVRDDATTT